MPGINDSVLLVVLLGLVAVVVRIAWVSYYTHRPGKNWLTTEGIVFVCRINTHRDSNGEEYFEPRIKCQYKVNDISYTLNLKGQVFWASTQHEWENIALFYPSGYSAIVRYDPKNPKNACLEPYASVTAGGHSATGQAKRDEGL